MGLGDEILAAGQAKKLGRPVKIGDGERVYWNPLYEYIPYIDHEGEWFLDYPGHRGYLDHIEKREDGEQFVFNLEYRAEPAIIEIEPIENDYVIIEPNLKEGSPPGKYYPFFDQVVHACDCNFAQFNDDSLGCTSINTDVVTAARYIAGCRAYIGVEGFLHHLAGAFHKPAVVLMGAYNLPAIMGYKEHINISIYKPDELGHRRRSGAMWEIDPAEVIQALEDCCQGG